MFCFQLTTLGPLAVWVVVAVRVVVVFKFGDEGFDWEGSMVMESKGKTCKTGLIEQYAECLN